MNLGDDIDLVESVIDTEEWFTDEMIMKWIKYVKETISNIGSIDSCMSDLLLRKQHHNYFSNLTSRFSTCSSIVVPFNLNGNHWGMAIINNRNGQTVLFDSFGRAYQSELTNAMSFLQHYLTTVEISICFAFENAIQKSSTQCGAFLCFFLEQYLVFGNSVKYILSHPLCNDNGMKSFRNIIFNKIKNVVL